MQWRCNRMLLTALLMALFPRRTLPWMARWLPSAPMVHPGPLCLRDAAPPAAVTTPTMPPGIKDTSPITATAPPVGATPLATTVTAPIAAASTVMAPLLPSIAATPLPSPPSTPVVLLVCDSDDEDDDDSDKQDDGADYVEEEGENYDDVD